MKELEKKELMGVDGGRTVQRFDTDGDGIWDIKIIERNDGSVRFKMRCSSCN